MSFWKIIKGLNFKQLSSLVGWFFKHPLYMMATIQATLQTFQISQSEFPGIHGKHNKANAFRHALWNVLIAKSCARFSRSQESILNWTKKITDWHEEFSPNEKLAEAMDYHNNRIGRDKYVEFGDQSVRNTTQLMLSELDHAAKIKDVQDMKKYSRQLVYIED